MSIKELYDAIENNETTLALELLKSDKFKGQLHKPYGVQGTTCLHESCELGNIDITETLLKQNINCNVKDNHGRTPLHTAALNGHAHCVDALIKKGADVNHIDNQGRSPLISASSRGKGKCLDVLMHAGAKLDICNNDGWTALHIASNRGYIECIVGILNHHANPNIINKDKDTALNLAVSRGHTKCVEVLLDKGANVKQVNKYGKNALHLAVLRGNIYSVELLLKYKSNVEQVDNDNRTVLHIAVIKGNFSIVKALLSNGCDPNAVDRDGNSALHYAVCNQAAGVNILELLVRHGSNFDLKNYAQKTAKDLAVEKNFEDKAEFLCHQENKQPIVKGMEYKSTPVELPLKNIIKGEGSSKKKPKSVTVQEKCHQEKPQKFGESTFYFATNVDVHKKLESFENRFTGAVSEQNVMKTQIEELTQGFKLLEERVQKGTLYHTCAGGDEKADDMVNKVRRNFETFLKNLIAFDHMDYLYQERTLSLPDLEEIQAEPGNHRQTRKMMYILMGKQDSKWVFKFRESLIKYDYTQYLVKLLDSEEP